MNFKQQLLSSSNLSYARRRAIAEYVDRLEKNQIPQRTKEYPIFNEIALKEEIERVWGKFGAHADVYNSLLKKLGLDKLP